MKPSDRDFLFYLEDIRLAIVKIQECVENFQIILTWRIIGCITMLY